EVLDRATRRLDQDQEISRQPEIAAALRLAVGSTYLKLGLLPEAERNLRSAVALRRSALGTNNLETLAAQQALVDFLLRGVRKFDEGEALSRETWQGRERLLGPDHRETLSSLECYAAALGDQKKLTEAEALARKCLETRERVFGPDDPDTINSLGSLG